MKKGISLIVLVITIIVMIIIAGAIIISLSQTNVIDQAETATQKSNDAEAKSLVALIFASNLYVESGEDTDVWKKTSAADLDTLIDSKLATEFPGKGYTVTIDSDYNVTYDWEQTAE